MHITKNDYSVNEYFYKNYINLDQNEVLMIFEWRNSIEIRKWMFSDVMINYDDHCNFIKKLEDRTDAYYWLVFKNDIPLGSFNISQIDNSNNSVEVGYFLNPKFLNSGEGLFFQNNYKVFLYNILDVDLIKGTVLWDNTRALQMSLFFGAKIISSYNNNNKRYLKLHTYKDHYSRIIQNSLIRQFVKYCKDNPVDWTKIDNNNE